MAECVECSTGFEGYSPLELSVVKSGDNVLVYAANLDHKNIILIKRLLLCGDWNGSTTLIFVREGGFFDFEVGGERIEPGLIQLKFKIKWPGVKVAQAAAEYIEVTGRSVSKGVAIS